MPCVIASQGVGLSGPCAQHRVSVQNAGGIVTKERLEQELRAAAREVLRTTAARLKAEHETGTEPEPSGEATGTATRCVHSS